MVVSVTTIDNGNPSPYKGVAAPGTFCNHTDQLGSIIRQTDNAGALSSTFVYDTFGSVASFSGSSSVPGMFTGKEWDDSTELYYFGARYYDPVAGRFLTTDNRTGGSLASRDVMNPYACCLNDPVNNVDALGHNIFTDFGHDAAKWAGDAEHLGSKIGQGVVHLVHNRAFQLAFSYTVDALLIAQGSALIFLGFGTVGTSELSAEVMGMIYDIQVTAKHQTSSWASWGEQLGIGNDRRHRRWLSRLEPRCSARE